MNKNSYHIFYLNAIILCLLISGCSSQQKLKNQNLAFIYQKNPFNIKESFAAYNIDDSTSTLFYKISTENLLFKKTEDQTKATAEVELNYKLYEYQNQNKVIYNGTISIDNIEKKNSAYEINGKIDLKIPVGNSYLLEITTSDFHRNNIQKNFLKIDKTDLNSRQNFLIRNSDNKMPLLKNYLKQGQEFILSYNNTAVKTLHVKLYQKDYAVAQVPFNTEPQQPLNVNADSTFSIDIDQNPIKLTFSKKGFYHIYADTANQNGFTLFIYDEHFPEPQTPQELISPLVYITSREEFYSLEKATNQKEALDRFWLQIAENPDRAKELIRIYYNRIKESNEYFSSYLEGWKTDRGIIFTIFGFPDIVYKYQNSEIWIYGEENNLMSLNFSFFKLENPFTDNDFSLDRSPIYRNNWNQAVDVWRQGRVY